MVVADTSPLNYLVLIHHINLLPELYGRVLIPESVLEELSAIETPQLVRNWATNLPEWIEVLPATPLDDAGLTRLHAGERDAISRDYEKIFESVAILVSCLRDDVVGDVLLTVLVDQC